MTESYDEQINAYSRTWPSPAPYELVAVEPIEVPEESYPVCRVDEDGV